MTLPASTASENDASESVSAIVISYFTGPLLARSLQSLCDQSELSEVILVDNGNVPGDVDAAIASLGARSERVTLISGHGNIGFAAACNKGVAAASGRLLLFFNPDALMPEGGLARLLADGATLARPWLMGAKLVDPDGREQQGSRRAALTPWRAFVEATKLYKLAPRHPYFQRFNLHSDPCPEGIIDTPTISGAVFMLCREDYDAINGMDERYFLHVEDVDFCLRFAKAGGTVYFNPHVPVTHYKSSSRANPVRIEARKTAGMIRYFNTHFSDAYPKFFLWIVAGALWAAFGLLAAKRAVGRVVRMARLRLKAGAKGFARARRFAERLSSR